MKNKLQISFLILFSAFVFGKTMAQNPIPNPDFETWSNDTFFTNTSNFMYDHPTGWGPFISGFYWGFSSGNGPLSCYKSTAKYTGSYALNLTTENDSAGADMVTIFPLNKRPLQLNGYYKFTGIPGDTSVIIVGITKGNPISWAFGDSSLEVGTGHIDFTGTSVSTYQPFSIPIYYKDLVTFPDSALIEISSTRNMGSGIPGQKLWVDNLYFSGTSGIDEENSKNDIRVYPNPVKNYLNIDLRSKTGQESEIEILDMTGRSVLSETINYFDKIDLSSLENGIYILQVKNKDKVFSKKIIKN
jgi:hypothetical protein